MKIALVPWDESVKADNIYKEREDGRVNWHILFHRGFQKKNVEMHTIDMYENLQEVDWFLFFAMDYHWLNKVIAAGLAERMIYCSGEPAVVKPENSEEGYTKLKKIFAYILTWNPELVDNERIFIRNNPYYFEKDYGDIPFEQRKLMTNISGNKTSPHEKELYSEREKVVSFFEKNHPDDFDLYGTGWKKKTHPSYLGMVDYKTKTYHKYRFALCLENTWDVKGYITEKICDCLVSGIVPVYWGARDITDYVPKACFVDYTRFHNLEEMYAYLTGMSEEEYNSYLKAADAWLDSDGPRAFDSEVFCTNILDAVKCGKQVKIKVSAWTRVRFYLFEWRDNLNRQMMYARRKMKRSIVSVISRG